MLFIHVLQGRGVYTIDRHIPRRNLRATQGFLYTGGQIGTLYGDSQYNRAWFRKGEHANEGEKRDGLEEVHLDSVVC